MQKINSGRALYRHFNKEGKLLYVGIALNILCRLANHRGASSWYPEIARIEIEHFADRQSALKAEREAIAKEKPLHNVNHKHYVIADFGECDQEWASAKDIRAEIARRLSKRSQQTVARELHISQPLLSQLLHGVRGQRTINKKVLRALGFKPEPYWFKNEA